MSTFHPKAYLLVGCPYSFKFLLFMSEAGILDAVDLIRCDPKDPGFEELKRKLSSGLGQRATFPVVEVEPGRYEADSDHLIQHFTRECGVANYELVAFEFYKDSIMPQVVKLHEMESQE